MTISQLARSFAVRASTLRFYERIGLLAPAGRVRGKREYDESGESRLAFILDARESGFTLGEIKNFVSVASHGVPPRRLWREAIEAKRARLQAEIDRLRDTTRQLERKASCRCKTLKECERRVARERCPAFHRPGPDDDVRL